MRLPFRQYTPEQIMRLQFSQSMPELITNILDSMSQKGWILTIKKKIKKGGWAFSFCTCCLFVCCFWVLLVGWFYCFALVWFGFPCGTNVFFFKPLIPVYISWINVMLWTNLLSFLLLSLFRKKSMKRWLLTYE